ncbi:MAG: asparagine synthase (glutamine-hydrolyzing) [Verrucomicrobia bacterium]|nr:asparagine synthase (glutamine-hydrolyzing) [Verrucomicrobiota bacterium]
MCGITGFVSEQRTLEPAALIAMRDALTHRGPDGCGLVAWNGKGLPCREGEPARIGLAHRRLSIIDLSDAGAQPMSTEDGAAWITYNGEFYNFQDYRAELEGRGHVFKSRCDTETILHLYEEYGLEKTLGRMNGMFAFGLWDRRAQTLLLARDRLGKKPLYYAHLPDGSLLFASEIKALLASGLIDRNRLDLTGLDQFWTFGFAVGSRTAFEQIKRLEPAQCLKWSRGRIELKSYWDCPFGVDPAPDRDLDAWADELEALLCDAIRIRLISDVPLGLFLSGGIDSSVMAALAARKLRAPVSTFSVSFPEDEYNEAPFAHRIAEHLGVPNTILSVHEDLQAYFGSIARQFDEPFGDSSAIPTYFISKRAREHVTVALTGDGGDEVFGGYETYREGLRLWGNRQQRRLFRRALTLPERLWSAKLKWLGPRRGFIRLQSQSARKHRRMIYSDRLWRAVSPEISARDREKWFGPVLQADLLSQMQYISLKVNMVDDILVKVDRMSMANSLECRAPLLDYRVVEFASRLPYSAKITEWGQGKAVLRRLLSRYVPQELYQRPKSGFSVPWEVWCRGSLGTELRERWQRLQSPLFRPEAAEALFPADRDGSSFRQWLAFSLMEFLAAQAQE